MSSYMGRAAAVCCVVLRAPVVASGCCYGTAAADAAVQSITGGYKTMQGVQTSVTVVLMASGEGVPATSAQEVPEYKCTLRADERSRLFKAGYRFPAEMTYKELCAFVSEESNKAGFDPLRPRIINKSRTMDYVIFYCVHARNHGDQSRSAKGLSEATSKRADRSEEGTRCLYTSCEFQIRVQRATDVEVATNLSKEELKEIKKNKKFEWYMDSTEDQSKDKRYIAPNCHCFTHTGHPRRKYPLADVTPAIRELIRVSARNNVSVASIQSIILDQKKVMLSDFQVCF